MRARRCVAEGSAAQCSIRARTAGGKPRTAGGKPRTAAGKPRRVLKTKCTIAGTPRHAGHTHERSAWTYRL